MEIYRIKHKPTGLYVTPNKRGEGNLSKKGEIYKTPHRWTALQNYPDVRVWGELASRIRKGEFGEFEFRLSEWNGTFTIHLDDPTQFEKEVLTIVQI